MAWLVPCLVPVVGGGRLPADQPEKGTTRVTQTLKPVNVRLEGMNRNMAD